MFTEVGRALGERDREGGIEIMSKKRVCKCLKVGYGEKGGFFGGDSSLKKRGGEVDRESDEMR